MINLLKKYRLILILLGIVLVLVFLKFFWQPKTPSLPTGARVPFPIFPQANITNRTINFQFNFSSSESFPKELRVYTFSDLKTENFPEITPDSSGDAIVTEDEAAIGTARIFLQDKNIDESFSGLSQLKYLKIDGSETSPASSSATSDIFVVNFWPQIENIPLVTDAPAAPPTSVWVGKNGKIGKAFATTFSFEDGGVFSLRPLKAATQDLVSQKGTLVWLEEGETYGYIPPKTVLGVVLEKVSLAYYLPSNNLELLEPIYVFEGKASIQGEGQVAAAVYLPALEEKYFINPESFD